MQHPSRCSHLTIARVIASAKGGSAKSTTAQHLAAYLGARRCVAPVVLSDADQNETSLSWCHRGLENPKLPEPKFTVVGADEAVDPDSYDHLIVDSAAAPDSAELAELMEVADLLIVPTAPSIFNLEAAIASYLDSEALGFADCKPGRGQ